MRIPYQLFLICISLAFKLTLLSSISDYLFQISKPYMGYFVILLMFFVVLLFANYLSNFVSKSLNKKKGRLRWLVDYKDNVKIIAIVSAVFAVFVGINAYNRQIEKKTKHTHTGGPYASSVGNVLNQAASPFSFPNAIRGVAPTTSMFYLPFSS